MVSGMTFTEAIDRVDTIPAPLSDAQHAWIEDAAGRLDGGWMTELLANLVEIPSPFGEEMAIAEFLAETMGACGFDAQVQRIDDGSANAIGTMHFGDGPSLLIFAPLDSPFSGRAEDDVPWVGDSIPDHMRPEAVIGDGTVTGLSADNPKAHITSAIAAAKAGARCRCGARRIGGPWRLAPEARRPIPNRVRRDPRSVTAGDASTCWDNGLSADFAIIAKPGYAVAW